MLYNKYGDFMKGLFDRLKLIPKDINYYETAFSHSSYTNEHKLKGDYERMEFLGDAVLDLAVSDYLYNCCNEQEGDMSKTRASYVCENALYEYAKDLNLSEYIKVGVGEDKDGGRFKKVILADTFEAMIGAIYLDLGFAKAKEVALDIIVPYIKDPNISFFSDYKSSLQEAMQTDKRSVSYELLAEEGPAHNREFIMQVVIDGVIYGKGMAQSKKEAEQEAAKDALAKLAR